MNITFYGVRGSIPAPGRSTFHYGGNTSCVEVTLADGTVIILDAGSGLRECGKALLADGRYRQPLHMLLTHGHWDHIIGYPFFGPVYRREAYLLIYPLANPAQDDARRRGSMFDGIHFPVRAQDLPARLNMVEDDEMVWRIGSATVRRVALNHPGGAQGFRIDDADGRSVAYLTDNELAPPGPPETTLDELARFVTGVDVLIHDAQYLPEDMPTKHGWGHSTVPEVLRLAEKAETPRVVLYHHDPDRDDDALGEIGDNANLWLKEHAPGTVAVVAYEGLRYTL